MKFYDLTNFEDEPIAEIIEFDDGACVLKFYIFKKIHCFDDFQQIETFIKNKMRLTNYKLIHNWVD